MAYLIIICHSSATCYAEVAVFWHEKIKSSAPDIPIERDPEKIRRLMARRFPCE